MKEKFNKEKDFATPSGDAEKMYAICSIIEQLVEARTCQWGKPVKLDAKAIRWMIDESAKVFGQEKMLLEVEAPIKIFGDIHGQFFDLFRLFEITGYPDGKQKYLFIGDYVDRGKQSIETICLLIAYKIRFPKQFFMLRGNHECGSINRMYGFYDECKRRYNVRLWKEFENCFNMLPVAAMVDDRILCMHGGLSPDLTDLDIINNQSRPQEPPDAGLLCDLLWSDPDNEISGWTENDRGVSYVFGQDVIKKFNRRHHLNLICRAHQVVVDGYEFMANRGLVTLFSAPNYCGEFDNNAGILSVDETLCCSFDILKPVDRKTLKKHLKEKEKQ